MNKVSRLTEKQIEKLAVEIRTFLLNHDMWADTTIYFNGKCFSTYDKETGKFYYNDPKHLVVIEDEDPRDYFEYVAEDHILSILHLITFMQFHLLSQIQKFQCFR